QDSSTLDAPRYSVGIDLGTTNCAMAFANVEDADTPPIDLVPVPQLVAPSEVAPLTLLPSFLYVVGEFDFPAGSLALPWSGDDPPPQLVGDLARKRGAESPKRLVSSAKSWLSNASANRNAPILPWEAPEEVPKLSPVAASAEYLLHLRRAWDARVAAAEPTQT